MLSSEQCMRQAQASAALFDAGTPSTVLLLCEAVRLLDVVPDEEAQSLRAKHARTVLNFCAALLESGDFAQVRLAKAALGFLKNEETIALTEKADGMLPALAQAYFQAQRATDWQTNPAIAQRVAAQLKPLEQDYAQARALANEIRAQRINKQRGKLLARTKGKHKRLGRILAASVAALLVVVVLLRVTIPLWAFQHPVGRGVPDGAVRYDTALVDAGTLVSIATWLTLGQVRFPNGSTACDLNFEAGVKTVTLPASAVSVSAIPLSLERFVLLPQNERLGERDGVLYNRDLTALIAYPPSHSGTSYTVPNDVLLIRASAFFRAGSLTGIVLPSGLAAVERAAFAQSGLVQVHLPSGLTELGRAAFSTCLSLRAATLPDGLCYLQAETFLGCTALAAIELPTALLEIGEAAFSGSGLERLTIPDGVRKIGAEAFRNCHTLTQITIGSAVTSIGENAFASCEKLTICGAAGSYAQSYALQNGIPFRAA